LDDRQHKSMLRSYQLLQSKHIQNPMTMQTDWHLSTHKQIHRQTQTHTKHRHTQKHTNPDTNDSCKR